MSQHHSHVFGFTPHSVARPQSRKFLELARNRLILKTSLLIMALVCIAGRLVSLALFSQQGDTQMLANARPHSGTRAEIIDMHGETLASTIITASLMANAQKIDNIAQVSQRLAQALPHLSIHWIQERLQSGKSFIWLSRHLTPQQQAAVLRLGIPGLELIPDEKRIYPHGRLFSHVVGMTNVDNQGISGAELAFHKHLDQNKDPLQLSLDVRVQEIAYHELKEGIEHFKADAGNAIVIHLPTGEIRAMVSCPDFEPSRPDLKNEKAMFNRNLVGVYEMGSVMKIINTAMSLSSGSVTLSNRYNTAEPVVVGRFRITDFKGTNSWLTVPQVFVRSSNIGSGRMAQSAGVKIQRQFFETLGLLTASQIELVEKGYPIYPQNWTEVSLITISYGYGVSITPLHLAKAIGSLIYHGHIIQPTLIKGAEPKISNQNVIDTKLSQQIRALMRLTVTDGTARKADVDHYFVIGKTGTANKRSGKGYQKDLVDACFVGAIGADIDHPEYLVVVMLDNPKRMKETFGYNNAGWNAAPIGGKIMKRLAILYGLEPNRQLHTESFQENVMKLVRYNKVGE